MVQKLGGLMLQLFEAQYPVSHWTERTRMPLSGTQQEFVEAELQETSLAGQVRARGLRNVLEGTADAAAARPTMTVARTGSMIVLRANEVAMGAESGPLFWGSPALNPDAEYPSSRTIMSTRCAMAAHVEKKAQERFQLLGGLAGRLVSLDYECASSVKLPICEHVSTIVACAAPTGEATTAGPEFYLLVSGFLFLPIPLSLLKVITRWNCPFLPCTHLTSNLGSGPLQYALALDDHISPVRDAANDGSLGKLDAASWKGALSHTFRGGMASLVGEREDPSPERREKIMFLVKLRLNPGLQKLQAHCGIQPSAKLSKTPFVMQGSGVKLGSWMFQLLDAHSLYPVSTERTRMRLSGMQDDSCKEQDTSDALHEERWSRVGETDYFNVGMQAMVVDDAGLLKGGRGLDSFTRSRGQGQVAGALSPIVRLSNPGLTPACSPAESSFVCT
ncbi:hypothetical protein BDK51DRAFT_45738 [Blyttiomyces helicus]|uniref:Uncharacterized protein n=1 Tax=Blyttiomyces helicus TaxID=388810 RepID=A0A4P9VW74_9FUNG|nr:hypothetical protein BDK51DRAFT_45738 [Blyttiomyces helicus]|eukprot:RKO83949.1 hypothetical protein BDK51DRAFT_45738 [Blyttiomyces helicus]